MPSRTKLIVLLVCLCMMAVQDRARAPAARSQDARINTRHSSEGAS